MYSYADMTLMRNSKNANNYNYTIINLSFYLKLIVTYDVVIQTICGNFREIFHLTLDLLLENKLKRNRSTFPNIENNLFNH